jgi:hypothetical protein
MSTKMKVPTELQRFVLERFAKKTSKTTTSPDGRDRSGAPESTGELPEVDV